MARRLGTLARLWRDRRGAVLIYVTLTVGVMFGLGGLAIDGARLGGLHTEAQSFADHLALAAAGELDGNGDSIDRADAALETLLTDWQTFADTGPGEITEYSRRYLWGLPASDDLPITAAFETDDPFQARFVEVSISLDANLLLLPGLTVLVAGVPNTGTAAVAAVAGFSQYLCDITPLMMCNPQEDASNRNFTPIPGQQIRLVLRSCQGSDDCSNHWAPGDFAFLDIPSGAIDPSGPCLDNQGAASFACGVAAVSGATKCFAQEGVSARPGALGNVVESGINIRFDMFEPPALPGVANPRRDPNFAPGPNVTKGLIPSNAPCNDFDPSPDPPADTVALPRDGCFPNCPQGRFGNSTAESPTWSILDYWNINYSNNLATPIPPQFGTRYELYMYEIEHVVPDKRDLGGEYGGPSCHEFPTDDADRRVVVAGIINCGEHNVRGNFEFVPVVKFIKLFLTEPMEAGDLYVEVLDEVRPGADDGILHDVVQLYR